MLQAGFIYILTNQSMPDLVKVGMTTKTPNLRAAELSSTGVPSPFELEYYSFFYDMVLAEKLVHQKLSSCRYNKEFFRTEVTIAIDAIENIDLPFFRLFSKPENDQKLEQFRKDAEEQVRKEEEQKTKQMEDEKDRKEREEIRRKKDQGREARIAEARRILKEDIERYKREAANRENKE
jgi:hypothetical protein